MAGASTGTGAGSESVGPAVADLTKANPDYALKMVTDIKKRAVDLIPVLAFRAPGAARALSTSLKGLDAALKELQQAAATLEAVAGPIKNSAIPTPQPPTSSGQPQLPNPSNQVM